MQELRHSSDQIDSMSATLSHLQQLHLRSPSSLGLVSFACFVSIRPFELLRLPARSHLHELITYLSCYITLRNEEMVQNRSKESVGIFCKYTYVTDEVGCFLVYFT